MFKLQTNGYQTLLDKSLTDTLRDCKMDKSIEIVKETVMNNKGVVVGATVAGTVYKNKERKRLNMEVLKNFNFKFKLNYAIIALIQISNKN